MTRTLAHISDLHIGRDARTDRAARRLCALLLAAGVDDVLATGDVTDGGRPEQLHRFEEIFAPLLRAGRLTVVPGNHDRAQDQVHRALAPPRRVAVHRRPGLFVVRIDSTAAHNRTRAHAHGVVTPGDIAAVESALREAPPDALAVAMLHHHPLPLPADDLAERISGWLGWPNAAELPLGRELLGRIAGRCDAVLHGHRHVAGSAEVGGGARPLRIYNAGDSASLGRARVLTHRRGRILDERWIRVSSDAFALPAALCPATAGELPDAPVLAS